MKNCRRIRMLHANSDWQKKKKEEKEEKKEREKEKRREENAIKVRNRNDRLCCCRRIFRTDAKTGRKRERKFDSIES